MKNMNHIKTYESFLSNIFGKKNDSKTKNKKGGFFSKENDDLANGVYNSLKTALESQSTEDDQKSEDSKESKLMGEIARYADYKRSVKIKSKGISDLIDKTIYQKIKTTNNLYIVAVQKSSSKRRMTSKMFLTSGETYVLVINNRHFIDDRGAPTVSQKIAKNIWNLLDQSTR